MKLLLFHPQVATRDCGHCQQFVYDEKKGKPLDDGRGLYPRHRGCPPPCRTPKGCAKGTPEHPLSLSDENMLAFIHWQECRAVGHFPDDPVVRQNARLIQSVYDSRERVEH